MSKAETTNLTREDVFQAANEILGEGGKPSVRAVLDHLGRGSSTTVAKHLQVWTREQKVRAERPQPSSEIKALFGDLYHAIFDSLEELDNKELSDTRLELEASRQNAEDHIHTIEKISEMNEQLTELLRGVEEDRDAAEVKFNDLLGKSREQENEIKWISESLKEEKSTNHNLRLSADQARQRHAEEIEAIRKAHAEDKAATQKQHDQERDRIMKQLDDANTERKLQAKDSARTESALNAEITRLNASLAAEKEKSRSSTDALKDLDKKSQAEVKELRLQLSKSHDRISDLGAELAACKERIVALSKKPPAKKKPTKKKT